MQGHQFRNKHFKSKNHNMATLRFILKPLDTIFFGDEKGLFKQDYLQKSRKLPQQTSVLGFLRYEALRRSDLMGSYSTDWNSLIGQKSFDGSPGQSFGVISKISPVSIYNGTTDLYPLRNPLGMLQSRKTVSVSFCDSGDDWDSLSIFDFGDTQRYDPKDHSHFDLVFSDFYGNNHVSECEDVKNSKKEHGFVFPDWNSGGIFRKDVRPGITKSYKGIPNDEGFFETQFWRMHPDFAYSFTAEITDHEKLLAEKWKNTSAIVRFGGDRSMYKLSVVEGNTSTMEASGDYFVLLSDAIADNTIYNFCASAVSDTQHFRNMRTQSRTGENWHKRPAAFNSLIKDGSYAHVFLKHGSILIAKDATSADLLAKYLETNTAFRNIGYNHYKRFNQFPKGLIKQ